MTQVNLEDVPRYNAATGNLEVNGVPIVISGSGTPGADGKTVLYGTAAPTTEGVNGDFYIRTTTNFIYGPKAGGVWPTGVSIVGAPGAAGNTVLYGTAAPTTEGVDGNFYIRTTTSFLYGPKAGGVWPAGVSMIGTMPSNAVVIDPVTGLFKTQAGDSIAEGFVDTMLDALLLTGADYDDQSLIVKNPGDNVSNYFPVELFRMNSDWRTLGRPPLYKEVPRLRVTWPADTWDAGGFTLTPAGSPSGSKVLVESNPTTNLHGLTQATQVTGGGALGGSYVYVRGSTGAGTVDWTPGLVQIDDVAANGYGITLKHPHVAGLRTPVFATAGTSSPIIIKRISAPPLSINGGFEVISTGQNTKNSNQHKLRVRYGAAGCDIASSFLIGDTSTSSLASPFHHRCGIMNAGSTSVNVTTGPIEDADGWAYGTSGDVYGVYAVSNGSANTDILICLESSNAADIVMELVAIEVEWWR